MTPYVSRTISCKAWNSPAEYPSLVARCDITGSDGTMLNPIFWKKVQRQKHPRRWGIVVIICAKYKKNPSRAVDATKRTWFSKSRLNDLEDIGLGQGSSHATHPLMVLIICTKYGQNPSWTLDATGRTRKGNGQTDRQTDRQTDKRTDRQTDRQMDRWTGWIQYIPLNPLQGN